VSDDSETYEVSSLNAARALRSRRMAFSLWGLALEFDLDAAVGQGGGQLADAGQRDGSPGRERAGQLGLALAADHESRGTGMAAVQHPTQLVVVFQKGIGFIDEQAWRARLLAGQPTTGTSFRAQTRPYPLRLMTGPPTTGDR